MGASSSLDSHVRVWDLDSGKMAKSIDAGPGTLKYPLLLLLLLLLAIGTHRALALTGIPRETWS